MAGSSLSFFGGADELPFSDEPFEVFQDFNPIEYGTTISNTAPMPDLSGSKPSRRPLGGINSNTILKPQAAEQFLPSPSKMKNGTKPRAPLGPTQTNKLNKLSMPPPGQIVQTDSLEKKPFLSNFKTRPKKPSIGSTTQWISQTPVFPPQQPSAESHAMNANGKRELLEPPPITSDIDTGAEDATQDTSTIPRWDSFPPIIDDGSKPNHSYAQMIAMAILRSPSGKLTLSSIYKWISDNFSYYNPNDPGWQNSIRHNLSLHKSFRKIVRPKSDPGKGNYWAIEPGAEQQFLKEKPKGKAVPSAENLPVMSTRLEPSILAAAPTSEPTLPPPMPAASNQAPSYHFQPSSDATIPEVDNEEAVEEQTDADAFLMTSYSPIHGVSSSPPMPRRDNPEQGTPTAARAASKPRKAAEASMDDSGYMSALDSSALRPNSMPAGWASSTTRPRKKRKNSDGGGRAEVEIARLRSSPFSPTKRRSKTSYQPDLSSPLRRGTMAIMNPLTPPVKMKPPMLPPPSVSPNTNLRNHRHAVQDLLKTPAARLLADEVEPYSPEFNLETPFLPREYEDAGVSFWTLGADSCEFLLNDENADVNGF